MKFNFIFIIVENLLQRQIFIDEQLFQNPRYFVSYIVQELTYRSSSQIVDILENTIQEQRTSIHTIFMDLRENSNSSFWNS